MAPREYRLGRRGEAAEETRRRITQATFELHGERGIAHTSMKDIAERADVGVGTVYHHFPTYNDAITACGGLTMATFPPPSPQVLDGHEAWDRVRGMVATLMEYWSQAWFISEMRSERHRFPALDAAATEFDRWHVGFVHAALAPLDLAPAHEPVVRALTDFGVWQVLHQSGLDVHIASEAVTDAVTSWLRPTQRKAR